MMNFNLSKLDKRITIQRPVKTADAMGGFTETWTDVIEVWAAIWPQSAKSLMAEKIQDNQSVSEITHRIRIRYRRGVHASFRINYKHRYFNIMVIVNPDEDSEWLDILCKEAA